VTAAQGQGDWLKISVDLAHGSERWRTLAICGVCLLLVAATDGFRGSPAPRPSGAVSAPPPAAPTAAAANPATAPPVMTPIVTAPVAPPPVAIAPTRNLRPVARKETAGEPRPFAVIDSGVRTETRSAVTPLK